MIVMCFDLSSVCIGVTFAQLRGKEIAYLKTMPIIPKQPDGRDLGYTTKHPKQIEYNGVKFSGFLLPGETKISKRKARERISEFKRYSHRTLLTDIGKQCGYFLGRVRPDVIAIEKNKVFNGILTTKLLAEISGGLYFYAGAKEITLYDFDVDTIRAKIRKDIMKFTRYKTGTYTVAVDTKWEIYCRLRSFFESNYPSLIDFEKMTMDESDSLAVFYYLYKEVLQKKQG